MPEGYWLIADRQTAGRGRQGREWNDSLGNFMGSTVIRLTGREAIPSTLALIAGLAVHETVLSRLMLPGRLELKWPNDLLLSGDKLAGILLERVGDAVIVGIGVNLARGPRLAGRETASLGQFGPAPDRDAFATDLAANFVKEVAQWRAYGVDPVHTRWLAAAHPQGTPLTVHNQHGKSVSGAFDGLGPDGALRLRLADGSCHVIHAADVSLERA